MFRRLSVFRGGWTLEAAEAVCGGGPVEDWDVVDVLMRLADKSLVVVGEAAGAARYRFLETVREYARERRNAAGERDAYRGRHLAHVVELASTVGVAGDAASTRAPTDPERLLARMRADNENIRAAVEWACETRDAAAAVRLGRDLWQYWADSGQLTGGRGCLERILALGGDGDPRARSFARYGLALMVRMLRDPAAEAHLDRALEDFRAVGERLGEAWCLNDLGLVLLERGNIDVAEAHFDASLAIKREVSSPFDQAITILNFGVVAEQREAWSAALAYYDQSLAICDTGPAPATAQEVSQLAQARIVGYGNGGDVLLDIDRLTEAETRYRRSMSLCTSHGVWVQISEQVARFAWLAAARAQWTRSARLIGAAERLFAALDTTFDTDISRRRHARATAATRAALGDAAFDAACAEGRAMDRDAAVAYALGDGDG